MRRNFDLIRLLLQEIEGVEDVSDLSKYTKDQQLYHSCLLIEAGLVHGTIVVDQNGDPVSTRISRLTWSGHEFLDMTRDPSIWNKVKGVIGESVRAAAIDTIKGACKEVASIGIEAAVRGLTQPRG
jgi:hypothetical protein